jgi:hypothetical protein
VNPADRVVFRPRSGVALARSCPGPHKGQGMSDEFWRAALDPSAPLPHGWPVGALGAFLLFCVPIGGGIPAGVLMARAAGVPPPGTAVLYLLSDVVLAFTFEPVLLLLARLGRWVPVLGRMGAAVQALATRTAGAHAGARGPLGLVLVSFGVDPMTGRAAAAAAGHGFVRGWAIAIAGDMLYFVVLMASTLWLQGMFGDERITIAAVLVVMLVLPSLIRRVSRATR